MEPKGLILGVFLFFSGFLFSQTTIATIDENPLSSGSEINEMTNDDWSFFMDAENKVYYIDFEEFSVNLSDIVVKNGKGEIVWKDDVLELPVNTIYELDFGNYEAGDYKVELHSFTSVVSKKVSVK